MPKRNIVWIVLAVLIAVLLWKVPETILRRDKLYNDFEPLIDVQFQILKNYVEPVEEEVLLDGAIDGMLNRLDPYCRYLKSVDYEQFYKRTEGQYPGIGIEVGVLDNGEFMIISPIEGSPAFQAGLQSDDRIRRIDGKKTTEMTLAEGVELITGEPGTVVTLTIYRPSTEKVFDKSITRQVIQVPSIQGWARSADWKWDYLIDPEYHIGYVRISGFERVTTEQLKEVMKYLLAKKRIRGLILDIRNNPGGLLPVVVEIANLFLSEGIIVSTKGRTTASEPYMASYDHTYPNIPLAVLINRGSASASEILAGALRDHGRAVLVGQKTYGKGSVQEIFKITDQNGNPSRIKLTTAYYYLPNGERIHGRGVKPDVVVQFTPDERDEFYRSRMAVYSTSYTPTTTQAKTATAPAEQRIEIIIDRQLQTALDILKEQITTRPAVN